MNKAELAGRNAGMLRAMSVNTSQSRPSSRDTLLRWERGTRYYMVHLHQDLWGTLCVTRAWGASGTAQGRVRHQPCASRAEAAALLWRLRRERRAHGYRRRFGVMRS